jgi:FtsH-binding integral membrane protein
MNTLKGNYSAHVMAHLRSVYSLMGICLMCCALGSYVAVRGLFMAGSFLGGIISLLLFLGVVFIPAEKQNLKKRVGLLLGAAFFTGHGMWPIIANALALDPGLIITSLLGTDVVFVAFSLGALTARPGSYLFLGHSIMYIMSMISLMIISHLLIGFPGSFMLTIYPYVMLVISCAFILYDTQMVAFRASLGLRDVVMDSALLFLDFVELFRFILKITSENKKKEKREK